MGNQSLSTNSNLTLFHLLMIWKKDDRFFPLLLPWICTKLINNIFEATKVGEKFRKKKVHEKHSDIFHQQRDSSQPWPFNIVNKFKQQLYIPLLKKYQQNTKERNWKKLPPFTVENLQKWDQINLKMPNGKLRWCLKGKINFGRQKLPFKKYNLDLLFLKANHPKSNCKLKHQ